MIRTLMAQLTFGILLVTTEVYAGASIQENRRDASIVSMGTYGGFEIGEMVSYHDGNGFESKTGIGTVTGFDPVKNKIYVKYEKVRPGKYYGDTVRIAKEKPFAPSALWKVKGNFVVLNPEEDGLKKGYIKSSAPFRSHFLTEAQEKTEQRERWPEYFKKYTLSSLSAGMSSSEALVLESEVVVMEPNGNYVNATVKGSLSYGEQYPYVVVETENELIGLEPSEIYKMRGSCNNMFCVGNYIVAHFIHEKHNVFFGKIIACNVGGAIIEEESEKRVRVYLSSSHLLLDLKDAGFPRGARVEEPSSTELTVLGIMKDLFSKREEDRVIAYGETSYFSFRRDQLSLVPLLPAKPCSNNAGGPVCKNVLRAGPGVNSETSS